MGLGISYAGFRCQSLVSATSYTVIGVLNKVFTVLVNTLMWDNHASPTGIASLAACLAGGALYEQAPLRKTSQEQKGRKSGSSAKKTGRESGVFLLPDDDDDGQEADLEAEGGARPLPSPRRPQDLISSSS